MTNLKEKIVEILEDYEIYFLQAKRNKGNTYNKIVDKLADQILSLLEDKPKEGIDLYCRYCCKTIKECRCDLAYKREEKKSWEEEFDIKIKKINYRDYGIDWEEIKSFITKLLSDQRKELSEALKKLKHVEIETYIQEESKLLSTGYNDAIDKVLEILK